MKSPFLIRPIEAHDDAAVCTVIRTVMPEFGADGPGFAIHDREVSAMCAAYTQPRSAYFVLEYAGRVCGGGGIAPLTDATDDTCELRKMYFLPEVRGRGAGRALMRQCLDYARNRGYRQCYLETLSGMHAAEALYRKSGFVPLSAPMGATGHFACNRWYLLDLCKAP